jgi:hypothetical protein
MNPVIGGMMAQNTLKPLFLEKICLNMPLAGVFAA